MTEEWFGPYRIVRALGRGGMGEVHEAYDSVRGRTVALKRLRDDAAPDDAGRAALRERFRRESRAAARLDSPHVVPIHDFGVIADRLFIDMRLVRGTDLGAEIAAVGALAPARAVALVAQVAHALDSAHGAGLVHRDVKPSNALLTRGEDFVYLADFGIVHVRDASHGGRLTTTGSVIGTPAYMAPEQLLGHPFDHRLDVYALGCVLFEALTGRPPFVGESMSVASQHIHASPPRPSVLRPGLAPAVDAVLLRALDKDPERRPRSAGELAGAARDALVPVGRPSFTPTRTAPVSDQPVTAAVVPGRRGRRRLGLVAGIVLAAAAVVVTLLVTTTSPGAGAPSVAPAAVEAQIVAQTGLAPAQVHCPDALPARMGASVVCTASAASGRSQSLRTTVTSVDGERVTFDITTE